MASLKNLRVETEPSKRQNHIAVRFGDSILVTGGLGKLRQAHTFAIIWLYDLHKDSWSKHWIPLDRTTPNKRMGATAVTVNSCVYMFGGCNPLRGGIATNELWKLSRNGLGSFAWTQIVMPKRHSAAPRIGHTAWDYGNSMWVFGGMCPLPESKYEYLYSRDDDFEDDDFEDEGETNQLVQYHTVERRWMIVKTRGNKPGPRSDHATARIRNKVWLCGGILLVEGYCFPDVYELDLDLLVWTKIVCLSRRPCPRHGHSFTAFSHHQLLLHGGGDDDDTFDDSWTFDVTTHRWSEYLPNERHPHQHHVACRGLKNDVIVTGGGYRVDEFKVNLCGTFKHKFSPQTLSLKELIPAVRKSEHWAEVQWKLRVLVGLFLMLVLLEITLKYFGVM